MSKRREFAQITEIEAAKPIVLNHIEGHFSLAEAERLERSLSAAIHQVRRHHACAAMHNWLGKPVECGWHQRKRPIFRCRLNFPFSPRCTQTAG